VDARATNLFFAVPAPGPVRDLAGRLQQAIRAAAGSARLPALEGLHVTLAFLGPTPAERAPDLLALAGAAVAGAPGFGLAAAGTGGFPNPGRARVAWLGFEPQPALAALAGRLRAGLRAGRVAFDAKPFAAHLTLARFREPADLGRIPLPPFEPVPFPVAAIHLFQTVPGPGGSRYRSLGAVELGPG
jgi:2'-5' RNA ligase